jgi:GDP-fucose protein O-fucosyltransferase
MAINRKQRKDRLIDLFVVGSLVYTLLMSCVHVHLESIDGNIKEVFFQTSSNTILNPDPYTKLHQDPSTQRIKTEQSSHKLAGLSCLSYGGPSNDIAREMVYWEDIPTDANYKSPFHKHDRVQYITFEFENAGFNNNRMNLEIMLAMAAATGRTLVLPAAEELCHLRSRSGHDGSSQESAFSFQDFYHIDSISREHDGVKIITMEDFLTREAVTGNLKDKDGLVLYPPHGRTRWDRAGHDTIQYELEHYLRTVGHKAGWDGAVCEVAFPKSTESKDMEELKDLVRSVLKDGGFKSYQAFVGHPVPVDAPAKDRLREGAAGRMKLCIYDEMIQEVKLLHFAGGKTECLTGSDVVGVKAPPQDERPDYEGVRNLVHFYAFMFFQDWNQDLWTKRFIRDHVRYSDEIQCAAARVVDALREHARSPTNPNGDFDSFHIRRGDFGTIGNIEFYDGMKILNMSQPEIKPGSTVYVATDEKDRRFFDPLGTQYKLFFLDDFKHLLHGFNTNKYGMLDQLVAARGRVFFGCWFSTVSIIVYRNTCDHVS